MPPEDQLGKAPKLGTRQKAIIVVIVLVVLIIIWQAMGLFSAPATPTIVAKPATPAISATAPGAAPAPTTPTAMMQTSVTGNNMPMQQANLPPPPPMQKQINSIIDPEILQLQQDTQKKYITSLNELQMLKVQKDIAETSQAIANARLATVTAEKGISDLLTKPSALPAGAYGPGLIAPVPSGAQVITQTTPATPATPPPPVETAYVVISVAMKYGRWNAVLGYQGKLFTVGIGDVLPVDESVVTSIDKDGVWLKKDGVKRKLSLTTAI